MTDADILAALGPPERRPFLARAQERANRSRAQEQRQAKRTTRGKTGAERVAAYRLRQRRTDDARLLRAAARGMVLLWVPKRGFREVSPTALACAASR